MKDYLTDLEIVKIETFCADKDMHEAVRKVLLQALYTHGTIQKGKDVFNPQTNAALALASLAVANPIPDAEIGAQVRAMFSGINALKNAFDSLNNIKSSDGAVVESPYNEAV